MSLFYYLYRMQLDFNNFRTDLNFRRSMAGGYIIGLGFRSKIRLNKSNNLLHRNVCRRESKCQS